MSAQANANQSQPKRITWTRSRDLALLTQVLATGPKAFVSAKANKKNMTEEDKYNIGEVWTNAENGIMPMLFQHEEFVGYEMPGYQSILNHLTATNGLLRKHENLWKEGAGNKEEELDEFASALIEVADLYKEAKNLETETSAEKKEERGESAEAQFMQNEAVKKKYGAMSEDELKKSRRGKTRRTSTPRTAKKGVASRISVSAYCEDHESADEASILDGSKVPKGYRLVQPLDDDAFDEPAYLEETGAFSGVAGLRDKMSEFFDSRAENSAKKMKVEMEKQKVEMEKQKVELEKQKNDTLKIAIEEKKLALEEKRLAMEQSKSDAMLETLKAAFEMVSAFKSPAH